MKATKNAHDWSCEAHGTYGWRGESCRQCPEAPSEIAELKRQLDEALRVTFDPKVLDQMNVMQRQLAESQAREARLRAALIRHQELTRPLDSTVAALALPHDDTALKEYRDTEYRKIVETLDEAKTKSRNSLFRSGIEIAIGEVTTLKEEADG